MRKVIALDFDGTLFQNAWPDIGAPNLNVIHDALAAQENGADLVLWTCREGDLLEQALAACRKHGLEFAAVNDSTPEWKEAWGTAPRKIGATEYWDDRAVNPVNRKTGLWIYDPNGVDWGIGAWVCSVCHCANSNLPTTGMPDPMRFTGSKFCPQCGAAILGAKRGPTKE